LITLLFVPLYFLDSGDAWILDQLLLMKCWVPCDLTGTSELLLIFAQNSWLLEREFHRRRTLLLRWGFLNVAM
jgi:hypothetical protein